MGFEKFIFNRTLFIGMIVVLLILGILWKFIPKAGSSSEDSEVVLPLSQDSPIQREILKEPRLDMRQEDDTVILKQLDHDREEQKQTKYLKTRLEQTNLELEQEKALAEINKLKMENRGTFKDSDLEGQKGLPEIKVEYIGGNSIKKEAILSISGTSFQVKERSSPTDSIQVMSITDSGVTLHFSTPQEITKTIDYKPE